MKKASLCAVMGSGMLVGMQLLSFLINLGMWGSDTVHSLINIMQIGWVIGYGLVFYFFFKLYKKQ